MQDSREGVGGGRDCSAPGGRESGVERELEVKREPGKGGGPSPKVPKVHSSSPAQKTKSKVSSEVQGKLTDGSSRKNKMSRTSKTQ